MTGSPLHKYRDIFVIFDRYVGGGGIAPQALLLPHNNGKHIGGGRTGPPSHNNGEDFALSRIVYGSA